MFSFYVWELLAPCRNFNMEIHPFSTVRSYRSYLEAMFSTGHLEDAPCHCYSRREFEALNEAVSSCDEPFSALC